MDPESCCAIRMCNGSVDINQLVEKIDTLNICAGHPENRFSEISQARKGEFKSSSSSLVAFVDDFCPISLRSVNGNKIKRASTSEVAPNDH